MMPFIPTPETFLALALCGSIRDKIVPPPILADFLLYHLNLLDPEIYTSVYGIPPTNDLFEFLAGVARKTGKLLQGGYVDESAAAMEAISRFRRGAFGQWSVDRITPDAFDKRIKEEILARQRESRGNGDVVESRKVKKGITFQEVAYLRQKSGNHGSCNYQRPGGCYESRGKGKEIWHGEEERYERVCGCRKASPKYTRSTQSSQPQQRRKGSEEMI